ncbi:hypothetical protein [Emergencia sp.]|uniref:hypothetical protein n=1 Tax=Emergencia sp. TaxID=1926557 RepID=UPI003AF1BBF3
MKKFTNFLGKVRQVLSEEYVVYTMLFLALMLIVYFYLLLTGPAQTPQFTYSEF